MAFVRRFDCVDSPAHAKDLRPLQWAKIRLLGMTGLVLQTDMLQLGSITSPCLLQPYPIKHHEVLYFDHWAGNTANLDVQVCCC